jgi:hypothetical protein
MSNKLIAKDNEGREIRSDKDGYCILYVDGKPAGRPKRAEAILAHFQPDHFWKFFQKLPEPVAPK